MTALDLVSASCQARHAYWATHGLDGNRADADRAADLAYNPTVVNGPVSWKRAYPLRVVVENVEAAQQLMVGERPGS